MLAVDDDLGSDAGSPVPAALEEHSAAQTAGGLEHDLHDLGFARIEPFADHTFGGEGRRGRRRDGERPRRHIREREVAVGVGEPFTAHARNAEHRHFSAGRRTAIEQDIAADLTNPGQDDPHLGDVAIEVEGRDRRPRLASGLRGSRDQHASKRQVLDRERAVRRRGHDQRAELTVADTRVRVRSRRTVRVRHHAFDPSKRRPHHRHDERDIDRLPGLGDFPLCLRLTIEIRILRHQVERANRGAGERETAVDAARRHQPDSPARTRLLVERDPPALERRQRTGLDEVPGDYGKRIFGDVCRHVLPGHKYLTGGGAVPGVGRFERIDRELA